MEKTQCDIIKDLLPLYIDNVCSESSRLMVEDHLAKCEDCKKEHALLTTSLCISEEHDAGVIRQVKRRIFLEKLVITLLVLYLLAFTAIPAFIQLTTPWSKMNELLTPDMVSVTEDDQGNVWLMRQDMALEALNTAMNQYTPDGQIIADFLSQTINNDVDKSHVVIRLELYTSPLSLFTLKTMGAGSNMPPQQGILFNTAERTNIDKIIVLTGEEQQETVLWERKE